MTSPVPLLGSGGRCRLALPIGGRPALALGAQCLCAYGGLVQILNPQALRTTVG